MKRQFRSSAKLLQRTPTRPTLHEYLTSPFGIRTTVCQVLLLARSPSREYTCTMETTFSQAYVFCSLSYLFHFIGDNFYDYCLKDEITHLLKANNRLKFAQDVTLKFSRERVKTRCKTSYKLLKEEDAYDPLLDISPYKTFIQLEYFLIRIHHCVTVVDK